MPLPNIASGNRSANRPKRRRNESLSVDEDKDRFDSYFSRRAGQHALMGQALSTKNMKATKKRWGRIIRKRMPAEN
jgi:hypothetical protein